MMRRARWLTAGAVLGALGYQRLNRATRPVAGQPGAAPAARQAVGVVRFAARAAGHTAGATGWLARQAWHRRAAGRRPGDRGPGGVAGFISDVREGMDDYLDRHQANMNRQYRRLGNTLVTRPGAGGPEYRIQGQVPRTGSEQDHKTKDGR